MRYGRLCALLLVAILAMPPASSGAAPTASHAVAPGTVPSPQPAEWLEPPMLMYHRVDRSPGKTPLARMLTVSPEQLRQQLAELRSMGLEAISVADLYERLQAHASLDRVVVLTFDDGYEDQYRYAFPILMDAG
ncbi:MAG: hypothetical protein JO165_03865, partial [Candidatus Eremiobacteraeota bacterium]|nr:hypothetical protein [Candidatus Eremiobacteraeota bacterium]